MILHACYALIKILFFIIVTGHLYVKSDVYGFGVVLLELLSGQRALDPNRPARQQNLVDWARPLLTDKRRLRKVMDSRLEGYYRSKGAFKAAQLALRCLSEEPKRRPSMDEVVKILEDIVSAEGSQPPRS